MWLKMISLFFQQFPFYFFYLSIGQDFFRNCSTGRIGRIDGNDPFQTYQLKSFTYYRAILRTLFLRHFYE